MYQKEKTKIYNNIKLHNLVLLLIMFLATLLMGIGYAAVNSVTLDIKGKIATGLQNGVYIVSADYSSSNNAVLENSDIINVHQTMFVSEIELSQTNASSSITYDISVYNSTNETYYFQKVDYLEEEATYTNSNIIFTLDGLVAGTTIGSKETLNFQITFSYKDNIIPSNNKLTSYLNFLFKRKYQITYENLSNQYQTEIYEGETLTLDLSNEDIYGVNIYKGGAVFQDYTYSNDILTIPDVSGNLRISGMIDLGYDIVITDKDNIFLTIDNATTGNISVSEYKTRSLSGTNLSNKIITKVEVILTFSSTTGSQQSVDITINMDGQNSITKNLSFGKKVSNETVTVVFDNLSIGYNQSFDITNTISKITNQQITLHKEEIIFYFE